MVDAVLMDKIIDEMASGVGLKARPAVTQRAAPQVTLPNAAGATRGSKSYRTASVHDHVRLGMG